MCVNILLACMSVYRMCQYPQKPEEAVSTSPAPHGLPLQPPSPVKLELNVCISFAVPGDCLCA